MAESDLRLANPPIVEMVLDIDCDLPPGLDLLALESQAIAALPNYPKREKQYFYQQHFQVRPGDPPAGETTLHQGLQALQFFSDDKKQLVQVRAQGYSFNRLAPYSGLDEYLPEIERTWSLYRDLISPLLVRTIRLRYVNRILLPVGQGSIDLDQYFRYGPRLPEVGNLAFSSFFEQHLAEDKQTGNRVRIVLTPEPSEKTDKAPVIFDNSVESHKPLAPDDWDGILGRIGELRDLKNRVFQSMLTDTCLQLFQ